MHFHLNIPTGLRAAPSNDRGCCKVQMVGHGPFFRPTRLDVSTFRHPRVVGCRTLSSLTAINITALEARCQSERNEKDRAAAVIFTHLAWLQAPHARTR